MMYTDFGVTTDGKMAHLYKISNTKGMSAKISDFGCAIVSLLVPLKEGNTLDVVLGYDDVSGYEDNPQSMGCCIGRNANRISGASFMLNGKKYLLDVNENKNNLHSSLSDGYHKRIWDVISHTEDSISLRMDTPDMDQGFPGSCTTVVTYTITDDNELSIRYEGVCGEATPWNPTNHTYFNLSGHDSKTIEDTVLWINAAAYTPLDSELIPTGEIAQTAGTPMDFSSPTAIGARIRDDFEQLVLAGGYDHNYCLNTEPGKLSLFSRAVSPRTGLTMEAFTDLPGVQLYTGNFINEAHGKDGVLYTNRTGFCLETQYYPDNVNKTDFPSSVIEPGSTHTTVTVFKFCQD